MKLILASASTRRAEILHDAGLSFSVLSSAVDETPMAGESPAELVQRLADAKAELVSARAVGPAIIIAADTEVVLDGHVLGKPRTSEDARQMLANLSTRLARMLFKGALGATFRALTDATSILLVCRWRAFARLSASWGGQRIWSEGLPRPRVRCKFHFLAGPPSRLGRAKARPYTVCGQVECEL